MGRGQAACVLVRLLVGRIVVAGFLRPGITGTASREKIKKRAINVEISSWSPQAWMTAEVS